MMETNQETQEEIQQQEEIYDIKKKLKLKNLGYLTITGKRSQLKYSNLLKYKEKVYESYLFDDKLILSRVIEKEQRDNIIFNFKKGTFVLYEIDKFNFNIEFSPDEIESFFIINS
jgi:hypothetical protein